jgi:hypothetical protein
MSPWGMMKLEGAELTDSDDVRHPHTQQACPPQRMKSRIDG